MTDQTNQLTSVSHISLMHRPYGPRVHMDENAASAPAPAAAPAMPESFSDPRQAVNWLAKRDEAAPAATEQPAESAAPATAETESAVEADAAPAEQATGETQEQDQATEPPIPLPRSWTKEQAEHWNALPRETQAYLAERDSKTSAEVRRAQNEAAEVRKAVEAKQAEVEQARQNYESRAKAAYDVLMREQVRDFPDIKSMEDVIRLSQSDPLRYIQWTAHQQELSVHADAVKQAEVRATEEQSSKWRSYRSEQDKLAVEHIPELGDAAKGPALMKKAVSLLQDIGFTPDELGKLDGGEKLSLFDHRMQRIMVDAIRYRDTQAAKTAVLSKPVPTVQRPGVKTAESANSSELQKATQAFNLNPNAKNGAALAQAKRAAGNRR